VENEETSGWIIIKDKGGDTFLEIPFTVAAVGIIAVPVLAALRFGSVASPLSFLGRHLPEVSGSTAQRG
jgi:Domain of unknown function (DUF4342)